MAIRNRMMWESSTTIEYRLRRALKILYICEVGVACETERCKEPPCLGGSIRPTFFSQLGVGEQNPVDLWPTCPRAGATATTWPQFA